MFFESFLYHEFVRRPWSPNPLHYSWVRWVIGRSS
jgi:hypothetical protein